MFIPFLATTAVAATFTQRGAMSVQISILTLTLKAVSIAFLAAAIAAVALFIRTRRRSLR